MSRQKHIDPIIKIAVYLFSAVVAITILLIGSSWIAYLITWIMAQ